MRKQFPPTPDAIPQKKDHNTTKYYIVCLIENLNLSTDFECRFVNPSYRLCYFFFFC